MIALAFGKVVAWLFGTRIGRIVLVVAVALLAAVLTFHMVDSRAYKRGQLDCTTKHLAAEAEANQRQARENERRNKVASTIAKDADARGTEAVKATDIVSNETKEVIRYVYRDPPRTKPVAGTCVHPVDERVQSRIDKAVNAANGK